MFYDFIYVCYTWRYAMPVLIRVCLGRQGHRCHNLRNVSLVSLLLEAAADAACKESRVPPTAYHGGTVPGLKNHRPAPVSTSRSMARNLPWSHPGQAVEQMGLCMQRVCECGTYSGSTDLRI